MLARDNARGRPSHLPPAAGEGRGAKPAAGKGRACATAPTFNRKSKIQNPKSPRSAFTLVELLIVVVVIGMLLALLVPAVGRARQKANEARVTAEIKQLESAIVAFKNEFGIEPPSRFVIGLNQAMWDANPESKAIARRIWPQMDFSMSGGIGVAYPTAWGTGLPAGSNAVGIKAGECLMFFLGGVFDTNNAPIGFSKNPSQPFNPNGTARKGPFLEFSPSRIRDTDSNGMPEYVDPLPDRTLPYLYISSYEGKGYRTLTAVSTFVDLPTDAASPPNYTTLHDVYRVFATTGTPFAAPANAGVPVAGTSAFYAPYKPQSFQIISPGYDSVFGLGGAFNPDLPNGGLTSTADFDNLTNFHTGRLSP